jgi:hypothetical protein
MNEEGRATMADVEEIKIAHHSRQSIEDGMFKFKYLK